MEMRTVFQKGRERRGRRRLIENALRRRSVVRVEERVIR